MSEHRIELAWRRDGRDFSYETYPRRHTVTFKGKIVLAASAAVEYLGDADCADPEEALVSALASCHMLTFLAICARRGRTVDAYEDEAVGLLDKNAEGRLAIVRITLHPRIRWGEGGAPPAEEVARFHERAHRNCFIANTLKCPVAIAGPEG